MDLLTCSTAELYLPALQLAIDHRLTWSSLALHASEWINK